MNCLVSFFFYVIATTRVTATGYTTGYNWIQHATNVHYNVDIYEPERGRAGNQYMADSLSVLRGTHTVSALFTSNTVRDFSFALLNSGRVRSFFSATSFASS